MYAGNGEDSELTMHLGKPQDTGLKNQLVKDLKYPTKKQDNRKRLKLFEKGSDVNKIDFQKITLDTRCRVAWRQKEQ